MRIISNFKDYYDFISHQYGGGDPKIVYERLFNKELDKNSIKLECSFLKDYKWMPIFPDSHDNLHSRNMYAKLDYKLLIINAKSYLIVSKNSLYFKDYRTDNEKVDMNYHVVDEAFQWLLDMYNKADSWWKSMEKYTYDDIIGVEHPVFLEISRKIKRPVFTISKLESSRKYEGYWYAYIDDECPVLSDLGMPKLIPAQQLYQEISYFMGNMIYDTPDTKPPVEICNKDKIVKAGFDLKKSFRN